MNWKVLGGGVSAGRSLGSGARTFPCVGAGGQGAKAAATGVSFPGARNVSRDLHAGRVPMEVQETLGRFTERLGSSGGIQ